VKRTFFFVNREITDLFSMKRNQYYPFTTLIILDKASRTQQELLAELTATQWQHAVFVADFDARDREANSIVFDYFVHARP
jgi:hypothetical protein